ncbi:MAG: alpha/beta hydrolase [Anaerolineae bacterium]|nr:alpha/beta hydrolase [Anaerolineae bacterium]
MKSLLLPRWGAILQYHDIAGVGRPLIFVHGLGCASSSDYPGIAGHERLAQRRRILIDFLGSGFSDRPADFSYTMDAHAETVLSLLAALDIAQADVVGHSMGGAVAIVMANKRPDLIAGLVLSEPNLDPGGGYFSRRIAEQTEVMYVATGHDRLIHEAREGGNETWADTMAMSSPVAVYRAARSLVEGAEPSWRQLLETLTAPRTVLFGEYSLPDPDTERLPNYGIHVAIVPRAGHSMMWENPSGVANAIAEAMSLMEV